LYKPILKVMSFRPPIPGLALVSLSAGLLSFAAVAVAGDKIQFSDPGILLNVPQPVQEVKAEPGSSTSISQVFGLHNSAESAMIPPPIAVTVSRKNRDVFGLKSPFADDHKDPFQTDKQGIFASDKDQSDGSTPDVLTPEADATGPTNNWSFSDDREKDAKNGGMRGFATDNSRSPGDLSEKDKSFRDDGLGSSDNRFNDSNDRFDMSRAFSPNGHLAEEMIRAGLMSKGQQFRENFNPLGNNFQNANGFDQADPLRDSSLSGAFGKGLPDDSIFGKSDSPQQSAMPPPPTMSAWEDPASTFSPPHSEPDQVSSAMARHPEAPAILAIPRRPGSLFQ
jgi:hypothetical protein